MVGFICRICGRSEWRILRRRVRRGSAAGFISRFSAAVFRGLFILVRPGWFWRACRRGFFVGLAVSTIYLWSLGLASAGLAAVSEFRRGLAFAFAQA